MQQELLIAKVRQYEFLYNVHLAQYRDHNTRHEAWVEIGKHLKMTGSEARDAWSKLRNCFTNALKRRIAKKGGYTLKKHVPWKFEKQMAFLQPYIDTRQYNYRTDSNPSEFDDPLQYSEESQIMEDDETADDIDEDEMAAGEVDELKTEENFLFVPSPSTCNVETTSLLVSRSQQPSQRSGNDKMVQTMSRNSELQMQKLEDKFPNNLNETDMFYLSMSTTVQKLPQLDQVRIRMELCRLVSEAEMRHIKGQP